MKAQVQSFWGTPKGFVTIGSIGIIGYFLFVEYRLQISDLLPFLLLGACLLMHRFTHGAHGHGAKDKNTDSEPRSDDYQRGLEDGIKRAPMTRKSEGRDAG